MLLQNRIEKPKMVSKNVFHFLHLAIVTAWIRYRADMLKSGLDKNDILDSLAFRAEIAEGLCRLGKGENIRKRGRPTNGGIENELVQKKKRSQTKPIPQFDVRTDKIAHFPCEKEERQRCKKPDCGLKTFF